MLAFLANQMDIGAYRGNDIGALRYISSIRDLIQSRNDAPYQNNPINPLMEE